MSEKTHWPFQGDPGDKADRGKDQAESDADKARAHERAIAQRARHDRFIEGGKAHVRKKGLS
jgi:hypothetical protein